MSQQKTVKWFMENKALVQFIEDDEAMYLSEAVKNFLKDNPLKENEKVSVETKKEEDEVIVTKIIRGQAKQTSEKTEKQEEKPEQKSKKEVSNIFTVAGVSYKNKGIIFKEKENIWFDVDIEDIKSKGIKKDVKVTFISKIQEGKKNELITSIDKIEDIVKDKPNNSYNKSSNDVQLSIEAQASINAANDTVSKLFSGKFDPTKEEDGNTVKSLIRVIANYNFDLIQEIKNK